jgi:hypothetical protein
MGRGSLAIGAGGCMGGASVLASPRIASLLSSAPPLSSNCRLPPRPLLSTPSTRRRWTRHRRQGEDTVSAVDSGGDAVADLAPVRIAVEPRIADLRRGALGRPGLVHTAAARLLELGTREHECPGCTRMYT